MAGFEFNFNMTSGTKKEVSPETIYDTLVIGAGPAGLNAALYAARKGLSVGVIAERIGGQVLDTSLVENWLGVNRISGEALMQQYESHVKEYDVPISGDIHVENITNGSVKEVHAGNGLTYRARSLILATGTVPRKLGVPGEADLYGKGVSYCAICDGSFFAGCDIAVVGGGNAAIGAAIDLARIAKSVTVVQRSELRADKVLRDRLEAQSNVTVLLWNKVLEITGDDSVTGIRLQNTDTGEETLRTIDGVFIEIGHLPRTQCMKDLVRTDAHGEVLVSGQGETNIPGIFAAGDVTTIPYKQIVIAAAEGAKAALKANEYLNRKQVAETLAEDEESAS